MFLYILCVYKNHCADVTFTQFHTGRTQEREREADEAVNEEVRSGCLGFLSPFIQTHKKKKKDTDT